MYLGIGIGLPAMSNKTNYIHICVTHCYVHIMYVTCAGRKWLSRAAVNSNEITNKFDFFFAAAGRAQRTVRGKYN